MVKAQAECSTYAKVQNIVENKITTFLYYWVAKTFLRANRQGNPVRKTNSDVKPTGNCYFSVILFLSVFFCGETDRKNVPDGLTIFSCRVLAHGKKVVSSSVRIGMLCSLCKFLYQTFNLCDRCAVDVCIR